MNFNSFCSFMDGEFESKLATLDILSTMSTPECPMSKRPYSVKFV